MSPRIENADPDPAKPLTTCRSGSQTLTANAVVATVLGFIPASTDTVESEGRQPADEAVLNIVHEKKKSKKILLREIKKFTTFTISSYSFVMLTMRIQIQGFH
jgi:hypothetical protein